MSERKAIKRQLSESIPKHIEAIQQILYMIASTYGERSDNELAQATSRMSYTALEITLMLEEIVKDIDGSI